jgi:PAS domain
MQLGAAFEALLAQSRELMVVSDTQGRIHWANPAFVEISGWAECAGALLPPALEPEPQQPAPAETTAPWLMTALAQGRLDDTVVRLRRPAASAQDDDADPLYLKLRITALGEQRLWNMLDLRSERRAEQQARRVEELLDTAQEFGRIATSAPGEATGTAMCSASGAWTRPAAPPALKLLKRGCIPMTACLWP